MSIKPLNTEINRTTLAQKVIEQMTKDELVDYAVFMMATIFDKNPDYFYNEWERINDNV